MQAISQPKLPGKQQGLSTFSLLVFVGLLGFVGFTALKLVPAYLEFEVIKSALKDVVKTEGINNYRSHQIVNELNKVVQRHKNASRSKLDIQKIARVYSEDGRKMIGVDYEVAVPFIKNTSVLLNFKREVAINPYGTPSN